MQLVSREPSPGASSDGPKKEEDDRPRRCCYNGFLHEVKKHSPLIVV
jgi:hypothetical protein